MLEGLIVDSTASLTGYPIFASRVEVYIIFVM